MEYQPRVVLIGHSYIRRLRDFMSQSQSTYANLGLREAAVECFGVGGASISANSCRRIDRVVDMCACRGADVAVLHIGENDYGRISPEAAAQLIHEYALSLIQRYSIR